MLRSSPNYITTRSVRKKRNVDTWLYRVGGCNIPLGLTSFWLTIKSSFQRAESILPLIWFCFITLVWWKNLVPLPQPISSWYLYQAFTSSSEWFTASFTSIEIGQTVSFELILQYSNENHSSVKLLLSLVSWTIRNIFVALQRLLALSASSGGFLSPLRLLSSCFWDLRN